MIADDCYVKLLVDIPEALSKDKTFVKELTGSTTLVQVKKGDYLLRAGELCQHAYFINKGLFINLFISGKGEESVTGFASDHQYPFLSVIGYFTQTPSDFEIKAIEEGELLSISRSHLEKLSLRYPLFASYYQNAMLAIIAKHYSMFAIRQSCKAEEFLNYIYSNYAWMINRIPDKYIACYMGISHEWYCKLKKRVLKLN